MVMKNEHISVILAHEHAMMKGLRRIHFPQWRVGHICQSGILIFHMIVNETILKQNILTRMMSDITEE